MEYTKDVILNFTNKKELKYNKFKSSTSHLKTIIKNNKIITITLSLLSILIMIDMVLINSFLGLLSKIY